MSGVSAQQRSLVRHLLFCTAIFVSAVSLQNRAIAVVKISDGFGDGDRNNDGQITFYDTDINNSNTFNDPTADAGLISATSRKSRLRQTRMTRASFGRGSAASIPQRIFQGDR